MKLFSEMFESVYYRGVGSGSDSNIIEWWSAEKSLAQGYASKRGVDSKVLEKNIQKKQTFDVGSDSMTADSSNVIATLMNHMKKYGIPPDKEKKYLIDDFKKYFGNSRRIITDFWKSEQDKKELVRLLKGFGFTEIRVKEDGVETLGVIK